MKQRVQQAANAQAKTEQTLGSSGSSSSSGKDTYRQHDGSGTKVCKGLYSKRSHELRTREQDWLHDSDKIVFKSTRIGKGAKIRINRDQSALINCKIIYSSAQALRDGEWGSDFLHIEQLKKGQLWRYDLKYDIEWY